MIGDAVNIARLDYEAGHPARKIIADKKSPRGLRELAGDKSLADALHIKPEEWKAQRSIELPATLAQPPIAWRRHRPEQ